MSSRKTQDLGIKIIDHRTDDDPEFERFTNHSDYLSRMRELGTPPRGCAIREITRSEVHIIPQHEQKSAFDNE